MLIGAILGVGLMNSLLTRGNMSGVNWSKAVEVALSLLISPVFGFVAAAGLLLLMKRIFTNPSLYRPPGEGDQPPGWIRAVLLTTCGGVSLAHGSNDGQKGMGLILLVLIGFLPTHYALNVQQAGLASDVAKAAKSVEVILRTDAPEAAAAVAPEMETISKTLAGKSSLRGSHFCGAMDCARIDLSLPAEAQSGEIERRDPTGTRTG